MGTITHSNSGCWAEITLGNPRARCSRFGICEARVLSPAAAHAYVPSRIRHVRAWLYRSSAATVRCFFPALGMLAPTRTEFFSGGIFRVEVSVELPAALAQALGLSELTIAAGDYACVADADGYRIDFPIGQYAATPDAAGWLTPRAN